MNDQELIAQALNMWANYIETGNPVLSAVDAARKERAEGAGLVGKRNPSVRKALDVEQMKTVIRLRELAEKILDQERDLEDMRRQAREDAAREREDLEPATGHLKCHACNGSGQLCSKEARWEECFWCGGTGRK